MPEPLDLLVLGSGVAGLSAAVRAAEAHGMRVGVLTKGELHQATTRWAQGGVAAVLGGDPDSTDLHLADTLGAGGGLCDADAVRVLVDEGPGRVNELIALGARFDTDADGRVALAREGGHSLPRVVHAGGAATGAEIERALVEAVRRTAAALFERCFALDLVLGGGRCRGVVALGADGNRVEIPAANVLVATGGAGQLFAVTTNPVESTGDGVAMALRAGVGVADLEFVQFHPTALHHPSMPRPLLSEALRGHGALLRDRSGARFVDELLARDVVSRAMTARMAEQGAEHLWLDATGLEAFDARFPTIAEALRQADLDPAVDWLPIAPAAHYVCGGILADLDGASTLPGLWVAGEAACNGVHGANRLASNSLLDGMVFGPRVVEAIEAGRDGPEPTGAMRAALADEGTAGAARRLVLPKSLAPSPGSSRARGAGAASGAGDERPRASRRHELQRAMTVDAGVLRSADSLARAMAVAGAAPEATEPGDVAAHELANLQVVARAVIGAALARQETRGAHTRTDFPALDPAGAVRSVFIGP